MPDRAVLHEGRAVLEEDGVYCRYVGPSCSVPNPWPVDPDPRGVEAVLKGPGPEPTRTTISLPRASATQGASGMRTWGGCRAVPQEPRGPVSMALTLTGATLKGPAGNVGILRFLVCAQRQCRTDVSTMDTAGPPPRAHG